MKLNSIRTQQQLNEAKLARKPPKNETKNYSIYTYPYAPSFPLFGRICEWKCSINQGKPVHLHHHYMYSQTF